MFIRLCTCSIFGLAGLWVAAPAEAIIIDFETTPALPTAPSTYFEAGPAQEISVEGVTFNGGVVLGFPTNFPASDFSTAPNVYGTANHPSGGAFTDASFLPTLSIEVDPLLSATTFEGILFNGLIAPDNFTVSAFSSSSIVDTVQLANLSSNLDEGFSEFRLDSGGVIIDFVEIVSDFEFGVFPGEWNFAIDTIAVGVPIESVLEPDDSGSDGAASVPEPSSVLTLSLLAILATVKKIAL